MFSDAYPDKETIRQAVIRIAGASHAGIAAAGPVDKDAAEIYARWINQGRHGNMSYLERYDDVRNDPRLLLEGARTIIVAAFSYANSSAVEQMAKAGNPRIAEYALGTDYHTELRERLSQAAAHIVELYGGTTRICIDTAPLRERYWATRAGLGFTGINNQLIIPGHGSHFFLGTILWTGRTADTDVPINRSCLQCMVCVRACPGKALKDDGSLDARACLSYLTIESRDPLPDGQDTGNRLFGCDTCRNVCPMEVHGTCTDIPAFKARPEITALTASDWLSMTPERFNAIFRNSAVRRAKLPKLLDTLKHL